MSETCDRCADPNTLIISKVDGEWPMTDEAIADALHNKDVQAAVSLLRVMAVEHPHRAEIVLDNVQGLLDQLADGTTEEQ